MKFDQLLKSLSYDDLTEICKSGNDQLRQRDENRQPGIRVPGGAECATQSAIGSLDPIEHVFTYHDDPRAVPHYVEIREAAKTFAKTIQRHCPPGSGDTRAALASVREAVMWANASIACNGIGL